MKTQVAAATAALIVAASFAVPASAQNPAGANAQKFGIAVVDITYIFKQHQAFRDAKKAMQEEFRQMEAELNQKKQQIQKAQEQQKAYKPGSAEFKQLDEQIVRMNASLQVEVTQKRKEVAERDAKVHYETYLEVERVIKMYAERQGIAMVLRFNGETADPNNPNSILRSINKPIQFQNSIDITPDVLTLLNRMASQQASGQQPTTRR